ncbi:MAG TPA: hypothetical protein PK868_10430 [Phycicoccus sp.]|nr:hypothetical protein [Phycicoccus sp.]HQK31084.1 hypothetical protein [Phycicoccus sp.]
MDETAALGAAFHPDLWAVAHDAARAPADSGCDVAVGSEGPVRIVAVARSTHPSHASEEAARAVRVGIAAAITMLGATNRDLDSTQAAIPRAVRHRWRDARPDALPDADPGTGTSLVVAMASGHSVRVTAFGEAYAVCLTSRGRAMRLPSEPAGVADGADIGATPDAGHGAEGGAEDDASPDQRPEVPDPVGLDHPDLVVSARQFRPDSVTEILCLGVGPDELSDETWSDTLGVASVDLRRPPASTDNALDDPHEAVDGEGFGDEPPGVDLSVHELRRDWPELADVTTLPAMGSFALTWRPTAKGTAATTSPQATGSGRARQERSDVAEERPAPSASTAPRPKPDRAPRISGEVRRRLSILALAALILAGVSLAAWAWTRALPRPTTETPTTSPSATPSRTPSRTMSSSAPSTSAPTSSPASETTSTAPAAPVQTRRVVPNYVPPATTAPASTTAPVVTSTPATTAPTTSSTSTSAQTTATTTTTPASTDPSTSTATSDPANGN